MKLKKRKGFTIVELIVVMAIIAILTLIAVPVFNKYIDNANEVSRDALLKATYEASVAYFVDESLDESLNLSQEDLDQFLQTDVEIVSGFDTAGNPKPNCNKYGHYNWSAPTSDNLDKIMCVHLILEGDVYKGAGVTAPSETNLIIVEMYNPEIDKQFNSNSETNVEYFIYPFN